MPNLEEVEKLFSIVEKVFTILAISIGSIWAWFKYLKTRESVWNLEVGIEHEVNFYSEALRILTLYITLKNIGKISISPGKKGCEITVFRVPRCYISERTIEWKDGVVVVDNYDCIRRRGRDSDRRPFYSIEPGCTYEEMVNILVEPGSMMLVQARFWWEDDDDCITQYKSVRIN